MSKKDELLDSFNEFVLKDEQTRVVFGGLAASYTGQGTGPGTMSGSPQKDDDCDSETDPEPPPAVA